MHLPATPGTRAVAVVGMMVAGCGGGTSNAGPEDSTETDATPTTTASSTSSGGDSSTGDARPGDPPGALPDTRHCRFDGWAPGLLPVVQSDPVVDTGVVGVTALTVDAEGQSAWLGTDGGAVYRTSLDGDGSEPEMVLPPVGDAVVVGLAVTPQWLVVRWNERGISPAVTIERYAMQAGVLDPLSGLGVLRIGHTSGARTGAGLAFDASGALLVPLGDLAEGELEGPASDRTQRPGNLLRYDVASQQDAYDPPSPADNPWVGDKGPQAETWAYGLRDPAGCAIDRDGGPVWCVDVGGTNSEVSQVSIGSNLGWPSVEGRTCRLPSGDCFQLDVQGPQAVFDHLEGCGATSGALVRDGDPLLDGAFVFADRCSGDIWGTRPASAELPGVTARIGRWEVPPVAFDSDGQGRVWSVDADGVVGRVRPEPTDATFPRWLSDSGCFEELRTQAPAADVVPYEVNAALWTDGADKRRAFALPPGERLSIADDGTLVFPEGSIVLKTFAFPLDPDRPDDLQAVETRVMILRRLGWEFHSYRWNEDGTDAELLLDGDEIALPKMLGVEPLPYSYPSRVECTYCHGSGDANVLGLRIDQLDRVTDYGTGAIEQLDALASIGVLQDATSPLGKMAQPEDADDTLERRGRAYLHTNCGHCHRPGGWAPSEIKMDLRWQVDLPDTGLCERVRYFVPWWFDIDQRLTPGDPEASLVWLRASHRGDGQMPPLATFAVDPGVEVLREWIASMQDCE